MAESALLSSVNSIKRLRPDKRKAFYFLVDFYSEPKTIFKLGAMYDFRYSIYGNHIPNRYSHSRLIFNYSIQSWGILAFISFGKKVIRYEIITKINIITHLDMMNLTARANDSIYDLPNFALPRPSFREVLL